MIAVLNEKELFSSGGQLLLNSVGTGENLEREDKREYWKGGGR